jgi:hypothetical protein
MIDSEFFIGVVEDINDPTQLGRVRVRTLNHSKDKSLIPTDSLPWAIIMMPANQPSISGLGWSPTGILQGTWVIGFYQDGKRSHNPIILGSINGISSEIDNTLGLSDPDGIYPLKDFLDEPDTNRLARGNSNWINPNSNSSTPTKFTDTIYKSIIENLSKNIKSADVTWNQPEPANNPVYPFNKVFESSSGHIIEIDDSENSERLFIYHKSGTFIEIRPDGSVNQKIQNDDFSVILNDKNLSVSGDLNVTVIGNTNLSVHGDVNESISGNVNKKISGNLNIESDGDVNIKASTINLN